MVASMETSSAWDGMGQQSHTGKTALPSLARCERIETLNGPSRIDRMQDPQE